MQLFHGGRRSAPRFTPGSPAVSCALLVLALAGAPEARGGEPRYISTYAGSGVAGLNGDGLPANSTALYLPQDGIFGPDGSFYFSDWNNHSIRRVRDGLIETIAGSGEIGDAQDGPALSMKLNHPTHVSFDAQGRMIISAWHNSKLKQVDLATGKATNLAGTGARAFGDGPAATAKFDLPSSAVMDSQGNLCISDQANFRLRRLDTVGNVTTFCGTGIAGYTGDGGQASLATLKSPVGQSAPPAGRIDIDADDNIYIADTANHVIRRIDKLTGTISTVAGTGVAGFSGDGGQAMLATLNTPSDVAVAPDGTLYIADTKNNRVRRVAPDGIITTAAGTGSQGYAGDGNLAVNAKLNRPYGVAISATGEVVIADTHNHRLRILTEEPRDGGPGGEDPPIVIIPCTGVIGSICTHAGTGFAGFNGDGQDRQKSHLYQPIDMEFTPSGRVYVLDWNNHKVRELLPDQTFRTVMGSDFVGDGPPGQTDLVPPGAPGLTIDLNHPTDMQEFPDGQLMVMNWHNHKIRVLDPPTGLVLVIGGGLPGFAGDGSPVKDARFNQPPHGVLDASGNLFIIDQRNQRLRMIRNFAGQRENAIISTIAGVGTVGFNGDGPALERQFSFPTGTNPEPSGGIALGAGGVLYFSDSNNHRIRRLELQGPDFTNGVVTTIAGTGTPGNGADGGPAIDSAINYPEDIELGPDGKLYFADANNHRVRRIDLTSGIIEAVAGTGVEGYSGDGGPAIDAMLNRPFGLAFDPYGNLYISDTFNNRIRKVKLTTTPEGPEPVLPADYRASYVEVRDCRYSLEHGGVYIRVLANPEAAQLYQDEASPLPQGTVIVKEEFSDDHCDLDELVRWRVMRKEAPGFDAVDGDWHWQMLTPRREVVEDTKASCIGCHVQPDCVRRDYMCTLPGGGTELRVVLDNLPATLVSVSGTPPQDGHAHGHSINFSVYAVGADPGDGRGPLVVSYDGGGWRRVMTGATGNLWWISERLIEGDFYLCGENGLILRLTPAVHEEGEGGGGHDVDEFERMTTPGGKLLFGVWGTDRQNLWAVGGDLTNEDAGGAVWKFNGTEWVADDTVLEARPAGIPTLYKVWGRAPDDVYVVGRLGVALHYNGARWTNIPTGVIRPLFTVHGNASRVVATGGAFEGVIIELDPAGSSFIDYTPAGALQVNGVFVSEGPAAAVGAEGSWATRGTSGWEIRTPVVASRPTDFHGTWMDSAGGVWAVGGDLTIDQSYGVLAFAGSASISPEFEAEPCAVGATAEPVTVSYYRDVRPLLKRVGCLTSDCHGLGPDSETDYNLLTYEGMFGPGEVARNHAMCDVVPGNPGASLLIEKLGPNPRSGAQMPNGLNPLTEAQYNLLHTWILEGAIEDAPPTFIRGDSNDDSLTNISDAITVLGFLFQGSPSSLHCDKAGDVNDDGVLNITDPIGLLGFLFQGGFMPPRPPFPGCGADPTDDDKTCVVARCTGG